MSSNGVAAVLPDEVASLLAEAAAVMARLQQLPLAGLSDAGVLAVCREVERVHRMKPTVDHRLIVEMECRSLATVFLARGTAGLLSEVLHLDIQEARARVRAALVRGPRTSFTGEDLGPAHPACAAAEAAGEISPRHADIVAKTMHDLPASLDAETTAMAEQTLAGQACALRPSELAKAAERLVAYLDPDGRETSEVDRARRRGFTIGRQRPDGMSRISGELDPMTRALVDAAFSAAARPVSEEGTPDPRSAAQRNHDALATLCRDALASGELPNNRGLPATVVVTMGLADLERRAGTASTASGGTVPVRDVLRMAAEAKWLPCVLDSTGQVLHLGTGQRLASPAQRLALYARDRGCTRPGCEMPAQWTQVHHLHEWQHGGPTDLHNLALVCPFDHRLITHEGFTVRMGTGGRVEWIAPRHLDPDQRPRTNPIHHPPDLSDSDPPARCREVA
ncbi:HNH endonuclease signature motif containing protein [Rhodococcus sp. X156]|uniref:HNH endonuclease signature motif containing protein n=1 Tax=Rhodococcus sp. X156 TaxID=2499145 RepID=UPI000FDCC98E|nr:HNH endonuclease signature motif containing protein [Rhodococcus sp. X156]